MDEVSKNTLVVQYNNIEDLQKTIQKNKDIAGVIVEPILANMGLILPEKNFLSDLRKITKEVLNSNQKTVLLAIYNNQNLRRYIGVKLDWSWI